MMAVMMIANITATASLAASVRVIAFPAFEKMPPVNSEPGNKGASVGLKCAPTPGRNSRRGSSNETLPPHP
jgi:hypothetical protein